MTVALGSGARSVTPRAISNVNQRWEVYRTRPPPSDRPQPVLEAGFFRGIVSCSESKGFRIRHLIPSG